MNAWPVSVANGPVPASTPWLLAPKMGSFPSGPKHRGQEEAKPTSSISPAVHCACCPTPLPPLVTRAIHRATPATSMEPATLCAPQKVKTFLSDLRGFPVHRLVPTLAAISVVTCDFTCFDEPLHVAVQATNWTEHALTTNPENIHSQV